MAKLRINNSSRSVDPATDTMPMSMIVGKIPPGDGLWGALQRISDCDGIRNGVLVVFSHDCSGRIGVFCNRFLTGAVIDASQETGLGALKKLTGLDAGMFCFRPCWADESKELGQNLCIDMLEVLQVRAEQGNTVSTSDAVAAITINRTRNEEPPDSYLADIADTPLESALVISSSSHFGEPLTLDETPMPAPPAEKKPAEKPVEKPVGTSKDDDGTSIDYLDWFDKQDDASLNLRRILLPVAPTQNKVGDARPQSERDLETYRKILQQEEDKVRKDIERTIDQDSTAPDQKLNQKLDDMQLLAQMLHSQEEMIQNRWQGLDQIPTPKGQAPTHVDSAGLLKPGGPVRSSKEFLLGCADLLNQSAKMTDPREFIKKKSGESVEISTFEFLHNPRVLAVVIIFGFVLVSVFISVQMFNSGLSSVLKEGKENIKAQRWGDAILLFDAALQKDPLNAQAHFYRGIALSESGEEENANKDFLAARNGGIPIKDIVVAQAGIQLRQGEWQKALDFCDRAITENHTSLALYRLRANANLHLGHYKDAESDCEAALPLAKKDVKETALILADRGYARLQERDFENGAKDFEEALKVTPDKGLFMLRGDAYRKVKRYEAAIEDYTALLDLDQHNYNAYVARGLCEVALHQKAQALKDFGRALQIDPNGVEALIQRGSLELSNGEYQQAVDDLQTAFDLNPTVEETRQKLAMAYRQAKGEVPKQLVFNANRESQRRKLPSDPNQLIIIGYNYLNHNDFDDAIDVLIEAAKKVPNNANARRYLAYAFARSGDFSAAVSQFKALIGLERLTDEDALTYCDALERVGRSDNIIDILMRTMAAYPNNTQVRCRLAQSYYRVGRMQEGDQLCQEGLSHAASANDRQQLLDTMRSASTGPVTTPATGSNRAPHVATPEEQSQVQGGHG